MQKFWNNESFVSSQLCVIFLVNYASKNPNYANSAKCLRESFKCLNLLSFQVFFGLIFNTKLSIFKAKTQERKVSCHQINQSKAFFLFQVVIGYKLFLPIVARDLYKKTSTQVPPASSIECLGWLVHLWMLFAMTICCHNVLYLREKNFHASLEVWKNIILLIDLSKYKQN